MKTTGMIKMGLHHGELNRGLADRALWVHIKPARSPRTLSVSSIRRFDIHRFGVVLFALSFVTPDLALDGTGIGAFLLAPVAAGFALSHAFTAMSWPAALLGTVLLLGWLANGTVFFQLSNRVAALTMALPWLLYFLLQLSGPNGVFDTEISSFVPFYLWAVGLTLIHGSRMVEQSALKSEREGYVAHWLRAVQVEK